MSESRVPLPGAPAGRPPENPQPDPVQAALAASLEAKAVGYRRAVAAARKDANDVEALAVQLDRLAARVRDGRRFDAASVLELLTDGFRRTEDTLRALADGAERDRGSRATAEGRTE